MLTTEIIDRKQCLYQLTQDFSENITKFIIGKPRGLWKKYKINDTESTPMLIGNNVAIFSIPTLTETQLQLSECYCAEHLDRRNPNNTRIKIETSILEIIFHKTTNKNNLIRLINVGNDQIGLIVILAKLHLHGYNNIQIINIQLQISLQYLDFETEEPDYIRDQKYVTFLQQIFTNMQLQYTNLYIEKNCKSKLPSLELPEENPITIIFAEDLDTLEVDSENTVFRPAISATLDSLEEYYPTTENIFVINCDGQIINNLEHFKKQESPRLRLRPS